MRRTGLATRPLSLRPTCWRSPMRCPPAVTGYTSSVIPWAGSIAREAVLRRPGAFLSLTLLGSGPGALAGERAATLTELLSVLDPSGGSVPDDHAALADTIRQMWHDQLEPQARADGTDDHIIAFLRERTLRTCPIHYIALARYLAGVPRPDRGAG